MNTTPTVEKRKHGKGHRYRVDGASVPGVTTIMRSRQTSGALMWWMRKVVAQEALDHRDELDALIASDINGEEGVVNWLVKATDRASEQSTSEGTNIHEMIENGDLSDPRSNAAHQFLADNGLRPVAIEIVGASSAGYAGTIDMIAEDQDGNLVIVDWKADTSGDKEKTPRVWPESSQQLAAYMHFDWVPELGDRWQKSGGATKAYVVALGADGSVASGELNRDSTAGKAAMKEFEACHTLWEASFSPAAQERHKKRGAYDAEHTTRNLTPSAPLPTTRKKTAKSKLKPPTISTSPKKAASKANGGTCGFALRRPDGSVIKHCANKVTVKGQNCYLHGG